MSVATIARRLATPLILIALVFAPASAADRESSLPPLRDQEEKRMTSEDVAVSEDPRLWARIPAPSRNRWVYCFGDPGYGTNGWQFDGTSLGWIRQGFGDTLAQRVVYDDSVDVMRRLGCHTVRAEIQPGDRDANGGTSNLRAQLYSSDSILAKHGGQPSLRAQAGKTRWYGFAFTTNSGYTPHYDPVFGGFNTIFSWHNSPIGGIWGPLANIGLGVATVGRTKRSKCSAPVAKISPPRLQIEINGGDQDDPNWPNADGRVTCRRYLGPAFTAGHRYRVQMRVKWGAHMDGALQVWIDDKRYVDVKRVSNVWFRGSTVDNGIYAVFENYSYYDPSLPTRSVYYGGLIQGTSWEDVAIP